MALVGFDVTRRSPYAEGRRFGDVGSYELVEGIAHYAVDPAHADSALIVDLAYAERGSDGRAHFSGDACFLLPVTRRHANGAVLLELPNRGKRTALRAFNRAPADLASIARLDPGDGFLLERGWCVAWPGWQWDVPRGAERLGFAAPEVVPSHIDPHARMQLRFEVDETRSCLPLTDQHIGPAGPHEPISPMRADDPHARLLVRAGLHAEPRTVSRERWQFTRADGSPGPATAVTLQGDFQAGMTYDLIYQPERCPVVGAGLLAIRDFAAWIRDDPEGLFQGAARTIVAEGQSQCGRLLRTLLHLGLHVDEAGTPCIDGALAHVAGGRFGEFNMRYGQPSVQPTPGFGHRFPFADGPQRDPVTGEVAGLFDRARARGTVPKVMYTDTSSEYWRGDAALTHVKAQDATDVALPDEARRYLFSSTQHGPGGAHLSRQTRFGGQAGNPCNVIDYRPLFRAALENLRAWIQDGIEPPPSCVPRGDDGTMTTRQAVLDRLARIPAFAFPLAAELPVMRSLDLGPRAPQGIGVNPAQPVGAAYPALVSAVDEDGNETAGIQMPDVAVPLATHTGFNPRHGSMGAPGRILEYIGSSVPFPLTDAQAADSGDPRLSIESRFTNREYYLDRVRMAATTLVSDRYLLDTDVETCVDIAAERYDEILRAGALSDSQASTSVE